MRRSSQTQASQRAIARATGVVAQPVHRVAPQMAMLEPCREQIAIWPDQDHPLLSRIQDLLDRQGVAVPERW